LFLNQRLQASFTYFYCYTEPISNPEEFTAAFCVTETALNSASSDSWVEKYRHTLLKALTHWSNAKKLYRFGVKQKA